MRHSLARACMAMSVRRYDAPRCTQRRRSRAGTFESVHCENRFRSWYVVYPSKSDEPSSVDA